MYANANVEYECHYYGCCCCCCCFIFMMMKKKNYNTFHSHHFPIYCILEYGIERVLTFLLYYLIVTSFHHSSHLSTWYGICIFLSSLFPHHCHSCPFLSYNKFMLLFVCILFPFLDFWWWSYELNNCCIRWRWRRKCHGITIQGKSNRNGSRIIQLYRCCSKGWVYGFHTLFHFHSCCRTLVFPPPLHQFMLTIYYTSQVQFIPSFRL